MPTIPEQFQWFSDARFGLFVHFGPYAVYGRGEQVLIREQLDQQEYARVACAWDPQAYDPAEWAAVAKRAGMRYAVLTTRHHDGYCLWDSAFTDYSSAQQAPRRDLVREYVEAFRAAGLRVGLYYSLADFRIPGFVAGPEHDPQGFDEFRIYVHNQVRELLSNYGPIDIFWFDGAWPHSADAWKGRELIEMMRQLQPNILINNRVGKTSKQDRTGAGGVEDAGLGELGDFGTPEHQIKAEDRLWESCQVSTWRLWGYAIGERWRPADLLLDMLVECASKAGNLLLNVGPQPDGKLPPQFINQMEQIGQWMDRHGEAIYGTDGGDVVEFITYGRQTRRGNHLYLVFRFWDRRPSLTMDGLATRVRRAVLLTTGQELEVKQDGDAVTIAGLPADPPTDLFPVVRLDCEDVPVPTAVAAQRLWTGDPLRFLPWASTRGTSVYADGQPR